MDEDIQITEAESAVMEVLWKQHPLTADEVAQALTPAQGWQLATVKTLLNRLLSKGALTADAEGRRFRYSPALDRDQWVHQQSKGLLERLFGGRVAPLVAHFSERGALSKSDVQALKRLIKEMDP